MKVFIGKYVDWFGPYQLAEKLMFWRDKNNDDSVHELGSKLSETWVGSWLEKRHKLKKRKVLVKIDNYDTWNLDSTLSLIIHPVLVRFKADKHSAGYVADEDVPEDIRSTMAPPKENNWDTDDFFFQRWEYVLDEMIWAFDQSARQDEDCPSPFDKVGEMQTEENSDGTYTMISSGLVSNPINSELYEQFHIRKENGFRLFGKYYGSLWS